jgi:hypothetical protein
MKIKEKKRIRRQMSKYAFISKEKNKKLLSKNIKILESWQSSLNDTENQRS